MPHSIAAVSAVLRFLPDKKGHKKWQDSLAGKISKKMKVLVEWEKYETTLKKWGDRL